MTRQHSGAGARGPLAPFMSGFWSELATLGYSTSAARRHVQLLGHLSSWLDREGLELAALATAEVEAFFAARRQAGYACLRTARAVAPLLGYLRRLGALSAAPASGAHIPAQPLVERFRAFLLGERGLVEGTVRFYVRVAGLFLAGLPGGEPDLAGLTAAQVTRFATTRCRRCGISMARQTVSALRVFLRYLRMRGLTSLALDQAVLSVAGWDPSLPRGIDPADVALLLRGCDRRTRIGRRDYAILLLLARLGLRGGEVVAMRLDDIDWRAGEVMVRGKRGTRQRLPLPTDVGQALAGYLRRGRPRSDSREVFLRHQAPFRGLAGTGAIRSLLERAADRAGVAYASPHRLRHTLASQMLRAGLGLPVIGQVLRHRGTAVTAGYAKVDQDRLSMLARPWPVSAA